jgi:uncharacterized protein YydD (DUF2326 family)
MNVSLDHLYKLVHDIVNSEIDPPLNELRNRIEELKKFTYGMADAVETLQLELVKVQEILERIPHSQLS